MVLPASCRVQSRELQTCQDGLQRNCIATCSLKVLANEGMRQAAATEHFNGNLLHHRSLPPSQTYTNVGTYSIENHLNSD